jgi:hypothetical protein
MNNPLKSGKSKPLSSTCLKPLQAYENKCPTLTEPRKTALLNEYRGCFTFNDFSYGCTQVLLSLTASASSILRAHVDIVLLCKVCRRMLSAFQLQDWTCTVHLRIQRRYLRLLVRPWLAVFSSFKARTFLWSASSSSPQESRVRPRGSCLSKEDRRVEFQRPIRYIPGSGGRPFSKQTFNLKFWNTGLTNRYLPGTHGRRIADAACSSTQAHRSI